MIKFAEPADFQDTRGVNRRRRSDVVYVAGDAVLLRSCDRWWNAG
jgi:hypothetical protein